MGAFEGSLVGWRQEGPVLGLVHSLDAVAVGCVVSMTDIFAVIFDS